MRIKLLLLLSMFLVFSSAHAANVTTYGKGITIENPTEISDILQNPDNYVGKPVKIKGMVVEVCSKRGCWINVASEDSQEPIQVKVTDGEIVFPMSATGKNGEFEGIVDEIKLSREQLIAYKQHLAEEKGQPFDPETVKEGTRYIRIVGLGANIEE